MKTIIISDTEKHPVKSGVMRDDDKKQYVIIFGLHSQRGINVVYTSRSTDKLFDVLSKYDLVYYKGDDQLKNTSNHYKNIVPPEVSIDMIGIAYRIRRTWSEEDYKKLVIALVDSIGTNESHEQIVDINNLKVKEEKKEVKEEKKPENNP